MRAASRRTVFTVLFAASLYLLPSMSAQETQTQPPAAPQPAPNDPSSTATPAPATPLLAVSGNPAPAGPLSLRERFVFMTHATFGPLAFVVPALGASYTMVRPPNNYPRDWSDGPAAYARNYGAEFGSNTAGGLTQFAAAAILHEDPRYYPSIDHRFPHRVLHAITFTVVNHSDSGNRTFAFSNFAGAGAAGFMGNLWEPDGFNNPSHALERASIDMATYAGHNLLLEFSPELTRGLIKLHLVRPRPVPDTAAH